MKTNSKYLLKFIISSSHPENYKSYYTITVFTLCLTIQGLFKVIITVIIAASLEGLVAKATIEYISYDKFSHVYENIPAKIFCRSLKIPS